METIFAQASAPGRAGVAIVRISGSNSFEIAKTITGSVLPPRQTCLRFIKDIEGDEIDHALLLGFVGPHSFTGEDVVELHLHGSIAVVKAVLALLSEQEDTRLAKAGEFTRRALENGKLDLTQVEGLADLIESETEIQRKQALRVLSGHLGQRVEGWRRDMIRAAALLEATIDFADEDVPIDVTPEVNELLVTVKSEIDIEIANTEVAERVRNGFEVAIVGHPNVGKSTLLNALAGRDAAITSKVAGTTRDIIEVRMDLGGLPVTLLDTAGLRESSDEVEIIGIERAIGRAKQADLRVFLIDEENDLPLIPQDDDIVVQAKADLREKSGVSGKTGLGVKELVDQIQKILTSRVQDLGLATHERHRIALIRATKALEASKRLVLKGPDFYDIAAEEMRFGISALETLVGRIDVENLLDEIFTSFCVGK